MNGQIEYRIIVEWNDIYTYQMWRDEMEEFTIKLIHKRILANYNNNKNLN